PNQVEDGLAATPLNPIEELLGGIWCELLEVERVRPGDNFFALGGHSLLATRLLARLGTALGIQLPLSRVFQAPTLAGLAAAAQEALRAGRAALPPAAARARPPGEPQPLSFAQQRLWFLDRLQPG